MRFEPIKYIEWFNMKAKAKYDLCSSSAQGFSLKNLDWDWDGLDIGGDTVYGYSPLLEAIAEKYKVETENIVPTLGTSHAIFVACAALITPGDRVLIETPVYEPLKAIPRALGADIVRLERKYEDNYGFDLERFESELTPQVKLVILTNPHNPSGALLSRSFMKEMSKIIKGRDVKVIMDEIYLDFLDDEDEETSFHLAENILVISSLTKVYGLGGLRCGWVLSPSDLVMQMRRIIDYTSVEGVFIGEQISSKMISQLDFIKDRNQELIQQNKSLIKDFIQSESSLSWVEPPGGTICFPRLEANISGDDLAQLLREKYDTAVVPGSFFEAPQHFRLGFHVSQETLARGLENIKAALQEA